jgi:P-type Mg2+ transporter
MPDVLDRWFVRRRASRQAPAAPPGDPADARGDAPYWALTADRLFERLGASPGGLTSAEAEVRLRRDGPNRVRSRTARTRARVLLAQLESPLLLLLIFAAVVSGFTGEWVDAAIVFLIVGASVGIGYQREYAAQNAAEALERRLRSHASVVRDRRLVSRPLEEVVAGDVVTLGAGSLVPGDGVILEATDFFVSEAALTGESFPVEKHPGVSAPAAQIAARTNCVFLGTHVRSGCATCLIARTGGATEFGAIAARVTLRRPLTEFDRGIQRFGYLLTTAMLVMVLLVFLAHVMHGRPAVETLLFAVALAVGLSPELLPAILSVNLARGAQSMAGAGVLVRRLNAIENLGSMDVLCTDKTGTLTEGVIRMEGAYDTSGAPSPHVLALPPSMRHCRPDPAIRWTRRFSRRTCRSSPASRSWERCRSTSCAAAPR